MAERGVPAGPAPEPLPSGAPSGSPQEDASEIVAAPGIRVRVRAGAAVALVLGALAVAVLVFALGGHGVSEAVPPADPVDSGAASAAEIYVHVLGAVENPGLYRLTEGARAIDAIASAGGFSDDADRGAINLARFVSDGEQLRVPAEGEVQAAAPGATTDGRVNLNTADATALETLPRVGPAMAQRIISWREDNGRFASIDDLRAVTGIGEKTFAALRDLVTV